MFVDNGPPEFLFTAVPFFISAIFILVFVAIILGIIKSIGQWRYNNAQPVLSVVAKVTSKRTYTSTSIHNDVGEAGMHHSHSPTTYFVTFEIESGDRMEFVVAGREYGLLADNDIGKLEFQGTRYLGFTRNN